VLPPVEIAVDSALAELSIGGAVDWLIGTIPDADDRASVRLGGSATVLFSRPDDESPGIIAVVWIGMAPAVAWRVDEQQLMLYVVLKMIGWRMYNAPFHG